MLRYDGDLLRLLSGVRDLDLDLYRSPPPRPPLSLLLSLPPPRPRLGLLISIFTLPPQILMPSSSLTQSRASLGSSISTNPNPGGRLATQTLTTLPILEKASSKSYLFASSFNPPT